MKWRTKKIRGRVRLEYAPSGSDKWYYIDTFRDHQEAVWYVHSDDVDPSAEVFEIALINGHRNIQSD